jgi:N-acetylated-alpha-linked acidic dipeptidase
VKKLLMLVLVFAPLDLNAQRSPAWDVTFRAIPEARNIGEYVRIMSARPHHLGSPYGRENAEWMLAKFKEWGWDTRIENYDVLFPTSSQKAEQIPSFNAYSVDGDVTGPLVYVNYGRPVDYEELDRRGISVKGAIVIARYGASWRGIKPKVAAERGAIGCLIYSDPRDDGYFVDGVFPDGPMRNKDGVQRGSVMDMPTYPGDPTTPGRGSIPGAERIDLKDTTTLTRIPVLPISYGDAQPLLAALGGDVAPMDWRGGLPLTYRIGPGPARVHLKLAFDWSLKRVHNVIARLHGSEYPDEWVVRGNHHDAWVNGAQDPASGMSAELEEARALGELVKQGWRPRRTIVYAAWDGEEQGLIGSTEWVEHHQAELREKAVVYINTDGNGRGFLNVGGSHALEAVANAVARDVEDPQTKTTVWKRMQALEIRRGPAPARTEARTRPDLRISALGSGSDYSAFLQHAGIPTLNLSFSGLDPSDGVYHSIYDDYYHFAKFLDTDFAYGRALAQTVGSLVIRFADADVLPFQFTNLADTVQTYVTELQSLLKDRQTEVREINRQIEEGVFTALSDTRRPFRHPEIESVPPSINFAPLENAAAQLTQAAERYRRSLEGSLSRLTPDVIPTINKRLIQSERQLTDVAGLPRRPWYRHLLYAPGYYTGYAVKTMPGVREAIEEKNYAEAEREVTRVADALTREVALINELAQVLDQLTK